MKRSEMVKKIMDLLPDSDDYADEEEKENMADCILMQIEKAGMLPPYNPAMMKELRDAPPSVFSYVNPNTWEKE